MVPSIYSPYYAGFSVLLTLHVKNLLQYASSEDLPTYDHEAEVAWVVTELLEDWVSKRFFGHHGLFSNVTTFFRKVQEGCNEGPLQDHEKDPMDVVMLCKEWVHSAALLQQPLAILPKTYLPTLDRVRVGTSERKVLSKKECEELFVNVLKSGVETDLKK